MNPRRTATDSASTTSTDGGRPAPVTQPPRKDGAMRATKQTALVIVVMALAVLAAACSGSSGSSGSGGSAAGTTGVP